MLRYKEFYKLSETVNIIQIFLFINEILNFNTVCHPNEQTFWGSAGGGNKDIQFNIDS